MPGHLQLAPAQASHGFAPQARPSIRVVLADDHAMVRRSLRLVLNGEKDIEVVAEAGDIPTMLRHVHGHAPHVLLMDLGMPNGSSLEAIRELRARARDTQIVVLTMDDDPLFAHEALDAGAMGYVIKDEADADLPEAIRRVASGQRYISRRVAAHEHAVAQLASEERITPREIEVLRLVALGYTSSEIASQLHVSGRTIETHRSRLHHKLGLSTRAELVRYALGRGLLAS